MAGSWLRTKRKPCNGWKLAGQQRCRAPAVRPSNRQTFKRLLGPHCQLLGCLPTFLSRLAGCCCGSAAAASWLSEPSGSRCTVGKGSRAGRPWQVGKCDPGGRQERAAAAATAASRRGGRSSGWCACMAGQQAWPVQACEQQLWTPCWPRLPAWVPSVWATCWGIGLGPELPPRIGQPRI